MKKTRETLWKDYDKVSNQIDNLSIDNEQYEKLLEERDKIRNELIKLEQATMDSDVKKLQIEAENKREKIRNGITIGTFGVSTIIGIWTVVKTFKFDESGTVTSTLGRSSISNVVTKMFKR
jgi:hypothetical protein